MTDKVLEKLQEAIAALNMDAAQTDDPIYRDECFHMIKQIKSLVDAYRPQ